MSSRVRLFFRDSKASTAIEYAVIAALVGICITASLGIINKKMSALLGKSQITFGDGQ